jgi:hypothetical protein
MRRGREIWILAVLLLAFVMATAYYTGRGAQSRQSSQPTTYSVGPNGLKALYSLYEREGMRVRRFEQPFTRLPADAGLLVVAEPFARALQEDEKQALWRWVDGGGALLLIVSGEWPIRALQGLTPDGIEAVTRAAAPGDIEPQSSSDVLLRDVKRLRVSGTTRLVNKEEERRATLAEDSQGAYVVAWDCEGGGAIIVTTDGVAAGNAQIAADDNAVFFVNIAQEYTGMRPFVLFDEFHQGFGSEEGNGRSLWEALGAPARVAFWYLAFVLLLVLYNANRRFGAVRRLMPPASRPSTDYIASMAGLFRRAGAAEIAVETLYKAFLRDLAARVDAPPDAQPERIAELGARRYGWNADSLRSVVARCERIIGGERAGEAEMTRLAAQIQEYRRQAELVRLS